MKHFRKPYVAIFLASLVLFVSCSQNDDNINETSAEIDFETALANFGTNYEKIKPEIRKLKKVNDNSILLKSFNNETESTFLPLIEPSLDLFYSSHFSEQDIIEMVGVNYDDNIKTAALGIMLYELNIFIKKETEVQNSRHENPIIECFNEATGIAAGIALVGALSGQAGGKAIRKAFMKFVKKIGVKVASGVGLALMAAEFVWCLATTYDE